VSSPTGPSESLPGLNAGESRTLHLPFVFTASGNYEAVVQTDTGNAVSETNEANNLEILAITVLPPGVNLVLEHFSVSPVAFNPANPDAVVQGRPARASITVTNTGNVPAGPFVVQWTPFTFAKPLTKTVSGLAPGATTTVTMEYSFPFAVTVNGVALVDSTNAVHETDELDNSATLKTVVEPPLPDLRVVPKSLQQFPAPAGSTSKIQFEVENNGNNPAGAFVVTWKPGPLIAAQSQQINGLAVGEHAIVTFENVYKLPASYEGMITVDSTHAVSEVNEEDNTTPTLLVVPAATVDLTVTNITIEPEEEEGCGRRCNGGITPNFSAKTVRQGVPNIVTVTVQNLGNSPSPSFVTSWNPDSLGIIVPGVQTLTQETGPLGPGESRELHYVFTYPKPGNFRSIADADAFNTVKETNEANNERILNITVEPAEIELFFTSPITFSPNPVVGEKTTASFTITNFGPIATEAFAVQFTPQKEGFTQTQFIAGLNPGESRTLSFPVTYLKKGTYTATAVIDPFKQVVKTQEPDEETTTITVQPKSAQLTLKLAAVEDLANPGGWQEWKAFLLAYQPGAICKIIAKIEVLGSSKEFNKEFKNVTCGETGGTLLHPFFNPGERRATNATVGLSLQENTPLVSATLALNFCTGLCLDIGFPGVTTLIEPRSSYLNPFSGQKEVEGTGCEEGKLNNGHCYNAFMELSLNGHVGMNALPATTAATRAASTMVGRASSGIEAIARSEGTGGSTVDITAATLAKR